jgi:hypothetical protein
VLSASAPAQQLVGYWIGSLPASNAKDSPHRFVLQANNGSEQKVVLYSIDQDREPWTPDSVYVEAKTIKIVLDKGRVHFAGIVSANGMQISGTWQEGDLPSRALVLVKSRKRADWKLIQPNSQDMQIIAVAKGLLSSPERWDRHDTDGHKCEPSASSYTLYCALQTATERVSGKFEHRDTALEEARFVIEAKGKAYPHRLMGYNNDPAVTFGMLQQLLDQIGLRVQEDIEAEAAADAVK